MCEKKKRIKITKKRVQPQTSYFRIGMGEMLNINTSFAFAFSIDSHLFIGVPFECDLSMLSGDKKVRIQFWTDADMPRTGIPKPSKWQINRMKSVNQGPFNDLIVWANSRTRLLQSISYIEWMNERMNEVINNSNGLTGKYTRIHTHTRTY